jgi:putative methyltransferase (TIGR04325 family)
MMSALTQARLRQIRFCSRWLQRLSGVGPVFAVIRAVREKPLIGGLLAAMAGYNRPFPTLKDAAAAISGYEGGGHSNPDYHAVKFTHATALRQGDYAALFHMQRILPELRTIFDLGGSVGELFYCYAKYLDLPEVTWTVCDLPDTVSRGKELARSQKEHRLRFTCKLEEASGTDLLMISGALHYIEQPLAELIGALERKPRHVIINRAPLVEGPAFAMVEDGETYRLACILHSRANVVAGLEGLGYELVDEWCIHGRRKVVPCYPDRVAQYAGLYFRARQPARVRHQDDHSKEVARAC